MPVRHVVCISVDGLRASALGAYGNTWHPTPALDMLASRSQVFDWMLCDRPTLEGFYGSAWLEAGRELAEQLGASGVQTALTTDDRAVAELAEASGFGEIRRIEFTSEQSALTIAETELAQLFAVAVDQFEGWVGAVPRLLWLHARGFHGAWDAPLELRQSLLEDDDPSAPTFVRPPKLGYALDHDDLLLHRAAYAAQTMVLDECVGALLAALAELGLDQSTLVILVGVRGYALGEHGVLGGDASALYGELLHVPCLVRAPGPVGPPPRSSRLVQPVDLRATLLEWFGLATSVQAATGGSLLEVEASAPAHGRPYVIAVGEDGGRAIRTPAWMLYQRPPVDTPLAEQPAGATVALYSKPDDRWEANEIADRCPEVAARLLAVLGGAVLADESSVIERLDDDLMTHAR